MVVLFADARYGTSGVNGDTAATIAALLVSNFLDFRRSGSSTISKRYVAMEHVDVQDLTLRNMYVTILILQRLNIRFGNDESMAAYATTRWVTESANNVDGSGKFGQSAQRAVVVQSMQAMLNSNQDIRDDESRVFNLMATPGYPELIGEMISLNNDRGLTAFIVGDSPATLDSSATSINEWGTNVNLAVEDNANGLTSRDEYLGVYLPMGLHK